MYNFKIVVVVALLISLVACSDYEINSGEGDPSVTTFDVVGIDGGKGLLCGNSVELLDINLARNSGLPHPDSTWDLNQDLKKFGVEIAKHFTESIEYIHNKPNYADGILNELKRMIVSRFKDIPNGQRLLLTNDSTLPIMPGNCSMVQIATIANDGTIHRDTEYWNKLTPANQAGLIIHDWIYLRDRSQGALTSDETTKVVGYILSEKNAVSLLSPTWNANRKIFCHAGNKNTAHETFEFFGIDELQNGTSGVSFYFKQFKGKGLISRVSTFLPGTNLDQFMSGQFHPYNVIATNSLLKTEWSFEIAPATALTNEYLIRAKEVGKAAPPFSNGLCKWE